MIWRRGFAAMLTALMLVAGGTAPGRADEPLNLRVGWAVVPAQLTSVLWAKPELLKHYGKSYTVEATHFRGSSPQITSLAAGELDLAALAFSSFALAIQNAHMDDIRAVSDLYQDAIPGYYSNQMMVRPDDEIKKVEDLKGKIVATNGIGGALDIAAQVYMSQHGLQPKRDYQIIEVEFPNMVPALEQKKVDMIEIGTPFSVVAQKDGKAKSLFDVGQAMGPTQLTLWAARAPFIAAHRAALVDFFEDMQTMLHWYLDPAHRAEGIKIVANFTKEPEADFSDWLFTKNDYYRDPDARPNLTALQNNIKLQKQVGLLNIDIDVAKYADLSLVDEAAKRRHP
ncbi:MAG TPA: ABC transporter substrate-binding protein [Stellaceae bacterium]|jgi:NitT/TauT family transport system substrate-binding protein|nr:ABC transporter substrate-binding protein [Stellaceae bacterium]